MKKEDKMTSNKIIIWGISIAIGLLYVGTFIAIKYKIGIYG